MKHRFFSSFILFFLVLGSSASAQNNNVVLNLVPIPLNPTQTPRFINDSIRVFYTLDTLEGKEALDYILKGEMLENFNKKKAGAELADNGFWLLFKLKNEAKGAEQYYLELAFNRTDVVKLYTVLNDSVTLNYTTGDTFNFSTRPVNHRNFIFPIHFLPNQEKILLLNLEKRKTVDRFPLKVYSVAQFEIHKSKEFILYGLFFGAILLVAFISIVASIYINMPILRYYGFYALSIGLFLMTSLGLAFQIITPNLPFLNLYNIAILVPFTMIMMVKFAQAYFNTPTYFPRIHKVYYFLMLGLGAILFLMVLPTIFEISTVGFLYYAYFLILAVFITSFITAYYYRTINPINAGLFILGYIASFMGIGYSILIDVGLVSSTIFTDSSLAVLSGFFVEFIFLTTAMGIFVRRKLIYFEVNIASQSIIESNGLNAQLTGTIINDTHIIEDYTQKLESLTNREKEVLQLIANEKTSNQIAEGLHLSIHTVQTHRKNIWKKLNIKSYAELIKIANAF